ncbi:hypothetical protein Tco_1028578 [Tanacetum coccineum]|uniref:Uncharacterized protein n=1 Tax=Tanacetum coccineum TaxID=301880 RepID=A0ABQ5G363_9ASTR
MSDMSTSTVILFSNFVETLLPLSSVPIVLSNRVMKFIRNMKSASVVSDITEAIVAGILSLALVPCFLGESGQSRGKPALIEAQLLESGSFSRSPYPLSISFMDLIKSS